MRTVLLTGASGGVGTMLRPLLKPHYERFILSDLKEPDHLEPDDTFYEAQLARIEECEAICEGVDGIVHLGGFAVEGPWEVIHEANIVGCYNLFEAARRQGVKRIVFASSNHAIGFYRRTRPIGVDERVRPDSRYGVSKAFGEALGSLYADKYGMGVMSVRIGNVGPKPLDKRRLSIWVHPEDLAQLCRIGLEHPEMRNEIVYGASAIERQWWDNTTAYRLGYQPKWRAEDFAEEAMAEQAKIGPNPVGDLFQGGPFCANEFANEPDKL